MARQDTPGWFLNFGRVDALGLMDLKGLELELVFYEYHSLTVVRRLQLLEVFLGLLQRCIKWKAPKFSVAGQLLSTDDPIEGTSGRGSN